MTARYEAGLRAWALRAADSGGRQHAEGEHPYRTCYQRDRDRILHCSAFRRLDYKTQVFVPHEQDHHRTRLTHTLEVAQIARTLARALAVNEDAAEAAALAHDLGHSPFGHAGEAALDELMAGHGGFEHNRQSLRVVDYLEHPYPSFRGLNLTNAVRRCLARHESRYDRPMGGEFDDAPAGPLEGQLVDLADEIAYTSADTYDALAAGWIDPEDLAGLEIWRRAFEQARRDMPSAGAVHLRIQACRNLLGAMCDDVLAETPRRLERLAPTGPADVQRAAMRCAAFADDFGLLVRDMQELLYERVYLHADSVAHSQAGRAIIRELFATCLGDVSLLPGRYRDRIGAGPDASAHRVICDYIAGMTDRFCRAEHARVCGGR